MTTDAKKQMEYLPWETSTGFMWGFPATVWLLFSRPHKAFSLKPYYTYSDSEIYIPPQSAFKALVNGEFNDRYIWSELFKPILFYALFMFFTTLVMACVQWWGAGLLNFSDEIIKSISGSNISLVEWNVWRLGIILITGSLREGIVLVISAIVVSLLGAILRIENIDVVLIFRILLYSIVSSLLLLVPVVGSFLMFAYLLIFIAIGISKSQNVGWVIAAVLSITAIVMIFFTRLLLRPVFDKIDTETIVYFMG